MPGVVFTVVRLAVESITTTLVAILWIAWDERYLESVYSERETSSLSNILT